MWTLIFVILMFGIFGKLLGAGLRLGWGLMKMLVTVVFFPIILIGMLLGGLVYLALPILVIVGIIVLVMSLKKVL